MDPATMAMIGSAVGGFANSMFGPDPYASASHELDKYKGELDNAYNPYINRGQQYGNTLDQQYQMLLSNPGALWNSFGSSYQQSPGYQFQMDQAMNASNNANAAGGMLGTSSHNQQNMQLASDIANQDYYNYMSQIMPMYYQGLSGSQGMYNTGFNATTNKMNDVGNYYATQAQLAMQEEADKGNMFSDMFGSGFSF